VPRLLLIALVAAVVALAGCSLNDNGGSGKSPVISAKSDDSEATQELGFPLSATKNTTRIAGADPAADAAGAVSAVFPATSAANRPHAVALVDQSNWAAAVAAGVLMSRPLEIPTLISHGGDLPAASSQTLDRLKPAGAALAKNAQVLEVGNDAASPAGYRVATINGRDGPSVAAAIDRYYSVARGNKPSSNVLIASADRGDFAMPAAAYAARSGTPVLFVHRDSVPAATTSALGRHDKPGIYVLGPDYVISNAVLKKLRKLGTVHRIAAPTPVQAAIALAQYRQDGFGWNIRVPGQNFTLANSARPLDAAAAAVLAGRGVFAPLLLTDDAGSLPNSLESYLLDVQPGYQNDPNASVYNHIWILGDKAAVSLALQGRLDQIAELVPVQARTP
jgi:hypothetical protein